MKLAWSALRVTEGNKLWLATAVGLWVTLLYGFVGRWTMHLSPQVLPSSAIDRLVPLIPWTFWLYVSIYLIYALSCILQRDLKIFRTFLLAYLLAYLVSAAIFLAVPTTFPRELYPVTPEQGLSARALIWFRTIDQATNCLPSMHVGSAVLSTIPFYRTNKKRFVFFALWALIISITTLTTKQHYLIDVLSGAALGWLSYRVVERMADQGESVTDSASRATS